MPRRRAPRRLRLITTEVVQPGLETRQLVTCAEDIGSGLVRLIGNKDREHFVAIHLNARSRIIAVDYLSVGTLDAALVHPREVFKAAILSNAAAIITAHNHPSGELDPSKEDDHVQERLLHAGELLGIDVLDTLIVTRDAWRSCGEWHGAAHRTLTTRSTRNA